MTGSISLIISVIFAVQPQVNREIVRFLYNVYTFSYKILFFKVGKVTNNVSRKKIFPGEIETISNINPQFINEIFKLKEIRG